MNEKQNNEGKGKKLKTIIVTGLGRSSAKPEQAELILGVSTQTKTATEARTKNTESMNQVIETLKTMGIPEADMETSRFILRPMYSPRRERLVGFEALHILRVTTTDLNGVGEIVDSAVKAGCNRIERVIFKFKREKLEELRKLARQSAIMDAKTKAETIAKSLGVKIVGVAGAVEEAYPFRGRVAERAFQSTRSTRIMPPTEEEIGIMIRVTFIIK